MKTRYKIIIVAVCAYFGVFFGPVIASNVYCDFIAQEMCTSRVTGVALPPFNMIPLSIPSDNECFFENAEGVMVPCYIETGYFEWPFPPRVDEFDRGCDEICLDEQWSAEYRKSDPTVMILRGAALAENQSLEPKVISVVLGKNNTIVWINGDDTPHGFASDKVGSDSWEISTILPGESVSVTFNQTGVFEYYGTPHPWITGKVIVLPTDYDEQTCAHLFDLSMNTFSDYVGDQEELGVIGISPQPDDLIFHSEFFEEWRYAGCMYSVDGWSDLSEHENFLKQVVKWESKNEN